MISELLFETWIGKGSPGRGTTGQAWRVLRLEYKGRDVGSLKEVVQD